MAERTRVLIVEDDAQIATALGDTLRDEGYEVQWASNGQEGLAVLARWVPHVILLDLVMPIMDGRSFRAAQRALPSAVAALPVIVLSGSRDARARAEELGAVAAITKPFDLDDVVRTVARASQNRTG
jgi:CheY-like chemotaxis protein